MGSLFFIDSFSILCYHFIVRFWKHRYAQFCEILFLDTKGKSMGFAACCSETLPKAEHKSRMPVLAAMRDWGAEYLRGKNWKAAAL